MNRNNIILICLISLTLLAGTYFYDAKYSTSNDNLGDIILKNIKASKNLYYQINNSLYGLNLSNQNIAYNQLLSVDVNAIGKINDFSLDSKDKLLFLEIVTSKNDFEIWKAYINQGALEKSFSTQTSGLENFKNFRKPIVSPDNDQLAFLASHGGGDAIFALNIKNDQLNNIYPSSFDSHITTISWAASNKKILFATFDNKKSSIYEVDLKKTLIKMTDETEPVTKIDFVNDKIIYLTSPKKESGKTANIYSFNPSNGKKNMITDLSYPKQVVTYDISPNGKYIVYNCLDLSSQKSDLFKVETSGLNLLQLTTDGKSKNVVFSANNSSIHFSTNGEGIFTMNFGLRKQELIHNSKDIINKLIAER